MAKDKSDTKTGDLLRTKNAQNQAVYKAKMRAEGKALKAVWVDVDSFDKGLADGKKAWDNGESVNDYLPQVIEEQHYDVLGYVMGFERGCRAPKE
ncbi:MAG: hypothetical protein WCS28_12735 [Thiomicrospira sp.]